jgi:hypothetical protein
VRSVCMAAPQYSQSPLPTSSENHHHPRNKSWAQARVGEH